MPGPNQSTTTNAASTSTSMSKSTLSSTSMNATTTTGIKNLSRGTLSLRFMQNAQRAKQQQAVQLDRKEIVDETKWEISRDILKEKWGESEWDGEGRGGEDRSTVTYESSYLPFMFSSAPPSRSSGRAMAERPQSGDSDDDDEEGNDSDSLGFNLLSLALRGRRKWKRGQERFERAPHQRNSADNQETLMADTPGNNEGDDNSDDSYPKPPPEDPAYTKNRPHIAKGRTLLRPLPQTLSKPGIVLKAYDKAHKGKSAREAIMDTAGVGEDLRTSMRKWETMQGDAETTILEQKRPPGFIKPSGVDEPSKKPSKPPNAVNSDVAEAGEVGEDEGDRDGMALPELDGGEHEPAIKPKVKDRTSIVQGARDRQTNRKSSSRKPGTSLHSAPEREEGLGLDLLVSAESFQAETKGKRGRVDDGDKNGQNKKRKKKGTVDFA